ncbi:MAG: FtsX-like permease family protein [Anaerolineales bacterium]|nr:FtsX-like permease family protein [Anaerolineales bacterium]
MLRPRWHKVLRDLWGNKTRTILVVLSIAIGVFAIGMIIGTQVILQDDMNSSYLATDPANAILYTNAFDQELVYGVRSMPQVHEAEGRRSLSLRLQVGPDQWRDMNVDVIDDFDNIRLNRVTSEGGAWPPPDKTLLLERASLTLANAGVGDTVTVETADGKIAQMTVSGLAHDMNKPPAQFVGTPYAYITMDTLEWLGFGRYFNELHIQVEGDRLNENHIQEVANLVEEKAQKNGQNVYWIWIPEPGKHVANEAVQPMLLILGVLGFLSLFASSFLVINIINGLLAQHTTQIGIMKAIGARKGQIVQMYLVTVIIFGFLSLLVAVPLGALAAYGLTSYLAYLVNFDLQGFRIPLEAIVVEMAVGILVPLLAASYPVIHGAGITVREALSEYGLGQGHFGSNVLDRSLNWFTSKALSLSRPMRISLRNTIRRKARLIFTLFTLTLGGAIFVGILSVHASLLTTLDDALSYFAYDVGLNFSREYRIEVLQREAQKVEGVVEADSWIGNTARRIRPDGEEGPNLNILGTQAETNLINPTLVDGRWLLPTDTNAVVINTLVLKDEPDLKVGDTVTLKIEGQERDWEVVGIVQGVMTGAIAYANREYLARELNFVGKSSGLQVIAVDKSAAAQADLARRLQDHFERVGFQVQGTETTADLRQNIEFQFNIIVVFLAVMAVLIALVGGLGLTGTMSINVLERTREIGVMRAVGASDGAVVRIVLVEGIFVGLLSWAFGILAAYPIGKLLSDTVGLAFMEAPLNYTFAWGGALGWLTAVLLIATLASILPAWNASRLSVRETLAYE